MSTTILIVILVFGLIMPLFWIIGAVTSVGYFCAYKGKDLIVRYQERRAQRESARDRSTVIHTPQLGLTMADGGDAIDNQPKGKES